MAAVSVVKRGGASGDFFSAELHAFVGNCWEALDGVGRLVNLCLYPRYPESGLCPPDSMTPQCTFYTVRRDLHRDREASSHPLARLLWDRSRAEPDAPYLRLSMLYHLSRFVPVPVGPDAQLPGWGDLPEHLARLVRFQDVNRLPVEAGLEQVMEWEKGFVREVFDAVRVDLEDRSGGD